MVANGLAKLSLFLAELLTEINRYGHKRIYTRNNNQ